MTYGVLSWKGRVEKCVWGLVEEVGRVVLERWNMLDVVWAEGWCNLFWMSKEGYGEGKGIEN